MTVGRGCRGEGRFCKEMFSDGRLGRDHRAVSVENKVA